MISHNDGGQNSLSYADDRSQRARHADRLCVPQHIDCPSTCLTCHPIDQLYLCENCNWIGHSNVCAERECGADAHPIPAPQVIRLLSELIELIEPDPFDPRIVRRATDKTEIPVSPFGVLKLLQLSLDQDTANALAEQLAEFTNRYVDLLKHCLALERSSRQDDLRALLLAELRR